MVYNRLGSHSIFARTWWVALVGMAVGFWLGLAYAGQAAVLPPAILLAIILATAMVWLIRTRMRAQSHAIWNAYAERESERARPLVARSRRKELARALLFRRNINARTHTQAG